MHATTKRVVAEAFAEEKPALRPPPLAPYRAVLKLERRVSHEGMVSVGGNLYSVPDTTWRRVLEVHVLADEVRIHEAGDAIGDTQGVKTTKKGASRLRCGQEGRGAQATHRACAGL